MLTVGHLSLSDAQYYIQDKMLSTEQQGMSSLPVSGVQVELQAVWLYRLKSNYNKGEMAVYAKK